MRSRASAFLKKVGKTVLITSHELDADSLASALILKTALRGRRVFVCSNGRVDFLTKNLARKAGVQLHETWSERVDSLILVDTSSRAPFKKYAKLAKTRFMIDHHASSDAAFRKEFDAVIYDPDSPACAQLVYENFKPKLDAKTAQAVLAAIFTETVGLRVGNAGTLKLTAFLADKHHLDVKRIFSETLFDSPPGMVEARVKAVQRAVFEKHAGYWFAVTKVNHFQRFAAHALIDLGADFVFAGGASDTDVKISARASYEGEKVVHLGTIMAKIGDLLGGDGGGHRAASGAGGPRTELLDAALEECVRLVKQELSAK